MTNVIEIEGLQKSCRRRRGTTVAVDGLDLTVPEGGVLSGTLLVYCTMIVGLATIAFDRRDVAAAI